VSHKMLILRIVARLWTHVGLIFQMIKSQPDIVHAHDVNTLPTGWLVSVLTRSPLIYDAHEISTDREGYASFRSIVGWVEKHLMPRAAASITTTDTRAKFFARAYGVPRPLVLQNRPRYELVERSQRIRNELNLQETWPIVLYQGGLQQGRGLERLVEAAAQVSNSYFVFIGGGRIESVLKELAHSLGLENRVYFIPTVSLADLPSYTASADIGVQPIENTCLNHLSTDSNKLFEYMMAGLPVVASSLPEIRTLVSEHELGLLVEPGSISELAFAICRLVGNDDLRHKFEKNAAIASQHLNWDEQEGALLSLYKDVLVGTY
jgi:glycosyltransferase involved in cell wall biosynthesis